MSCKSNSNGHELYQRADDKEEVIAKRLDVYKSQTKPLIDHYSKLGLLKVIKGEGTLELITARMEAALAKSGSKTEMVKRKAARKTASKKSSVKPAAKKASRKKVAANRKAAPVRKPVAKKKKVVARKPARKAVKKSAARKPARKK